MSEEAASVTGTRGTETTLTVVAGLDRRCTSKGGSKPSEPVDLVRLEDDLSMIAG